PIPISGFGLDAHLILPLIVLAVRPTLHLAKVTAGLLENELQQDYIQVAQSKGLPWRKIYWGHAFRNVIAPVTIVAGQATRFIVAGLLIAEMMFLWPGIGRFFVFAVAANENLQGQLQFYGNPYLIAALAVLMGLMLLTADLVADVCAYLADPRLREKR
ncbi:MAG: ABC transporter permease, partial [Anaerolineales bacterium]|nr:ABC transporter permease [Anaerolineales bacterium]